MASSLTQLKYDDDIEYTFTDTFDMNELKCIEIEPEMLDDLQNGKLEIRGDSNDEAVLVTSNKSYKIRQHDTSNTILLTSLNNKSILRYNFTKQQKNNKNKYKFNNIHEMNIDSDDDDITTQTQNNTQNEEIYNAVTCIYILDLQPPKLTKLHEILYQRPYKGELTPSLSPDDDDKENDINYKIDLSFSGLKSLVQCSDNELLNGLKQINAIEINNEWRIIDNDYYYECFQDILYCIMEHSIDFKKFIISDILCNITQFPLEIVKHCIKINCIEKNNENENEFWTFDENKICIFCAKQILQKNGNKMKESLFFEEWNNCLPYGINGNKNQLIGHFIYNWNKKCNENLWYVFEEHKLSLEPKIRFKQIFEMKDEWNMEQIKPYLISLIKVGMSVDKLLLRYAKMIRSRDNHGNEKKTYISRHVKRNR